MATPRPSVCRKDLRVASNLKSSKSQSKSEQAAAQGEMFDRNASTDSDLWKAPRTAPGHVRDALLGCVHVRRAARWAEGVRRCLAGRSAGPLCQLLLLLRRRVCGRLERFFHCLAIYSLEAGRSKKHMISSLQVSGKNHHGNCTLQSETMMSTKLLRADDSMNSNLKRGEKYLRLHTGVFEVLQEPALQYSSRPCSQGT